MPRPGGFHESMAIALAGVSPKAVTLDATGSTNDDARAAARDGAPHLTVVAADHQTAGRGRRDRSWEAAPGEALLASFVVRPTLETERWSILPLLAGISLVEAIEARTGVAAGLKWPNDVLVGDRKLAGILMEAEPPAFAIVGVGVNVNQVRFPNDLAATSLALEAAVRLDRADLLAATLSAFDDVLSRPDDGLERYRARCLSLGRRVRVERHDGEDLIGTADAIDERGALVIDDIRVAAGDVVHLR